MSKRDKKLTAGEWDTLLLLVRVRAEFCEEEQENDKHYAREAAKLRKLEAKILAQ